MEVEFRIINFNDVVLQDIALDLIIRHSNLALVAYVNHLIPFIGAKDSFGGSSLLIQEIELANLNLEIIDLNYIG